MATKIYQGKYDNSSDQIYLVDNGKIYNGKYDNSSDQIREVNTQGLLIKNDKVYKGKYDNSSDQIALIKGDRLTDDEFEKVVYLLAQRNNLF